jgi:hypothetical protein
LCLAGRFLHRSRYQEYPWLKSLLTTHKPKACTIFNYTYIHTRSSVQHIRCRAVSRPKKFDSAPKVSTMRQPCAGLSASHPRQGTSNPCPKIFTKICSGSSSDPRPGIETPLSVLLAGSPFCHFPGRGCWRPGAIVCPPAFRPLNSSQIGQGWGPLGFPPPPRTTRAALSARPVLTVLKVSPK